jgi:hypothetical protein
MKALSGSGASVPDAMAKLESVLLEIEKVIANPVLPSVPNVATPAGTDASTTPIENGEASVSKENEDSAPVPSVSDWVADTAPTPTTTDETSHFVPVRVNTDVSGVVSPIPQTNPARTDTLRPIIRPVSKIVPVAEHVHEPDGISPTADAGDIKFQMPVAPVAAVNPLKQPKDLPTAAELKAIAGVIDPLFDTDVDAGLGQLLSEWSLFKKSGFFGTGPHGREHPLFIQLAPLPMAHIVAGRYEGATAEVRQSITDYMNGWRYEQGIIYEQNETFEHYLRRVIKHILDLQIKKRSA